LQLPAGRFDAYLFDCDGTIVDSMPLHYKAWKQISANGIANSAKERFYAWGRDAHRGNYFHAQQGIWLIQCRSKHSRRARVVWYFEIAAGTRTGAGSCGAHFDQHGKIPLAVVSAALAIQ